MKKRISIVPATVVKFMGGWYLFKDEGKQILCMYACMHVIKLA